MLPPKLMAQFNTDMKIWYPRVGIEPTTTIFTFTYCATAQQQLTNVAIKQALKQKTNYPLALPTRFSEEFSALSNCMQASGNSLPILTRRGTAFEPAAKACTSTAVIIIKKMLLFKFTEFYSIRRKENYSFKKLLLRNNFF